MTYDKLSKIYYKDQPQYLPEYQKRFNGHGTYRTNLHIKPVLRGTHIDEKVELFIVNTDPLMKLQEQILINSFSIREMIMQMPRFAVKPYFDKLLVNELQSTNEIEGIRSTKKELSEALTVLKEKRQTNKHKRFIGLMKTYQYIHKIDSFESLEDFRKLYDDIVADEIPDDEQPDGELFRTDYVEVSDGYNKPTHIGVFTEARIKEYLNNLLIFLKTSDVPDLYKYMLAHYYYEYIHPFYDGNGRTGRLFVCSYIGKKLDSFTAVSLSYTINQDKQKYYKALEELSNPRNKGEATFYIQAMLEILNDGQKSLIEDLSISLAKVDKINTHIESLDWADTDTKRLLGILLNVNIFTGNAQVLSNDELQETLGFKTRYKIDKILKELESKGIVRRIKHRPVTYDIDEDFVDSVLS